MPFVKKSFRASPTENRPVLKRIFRYYVRYWPRIILGLIAVVLLTQCDLVNSYIIKIFIDIFSRVGNQLSAGQNISFSLVFKPLGIHFDFTGKQQLLNLVLLISGGVLVNIMLKGFFVYTQEYTLSSAIQKALKDIRQDIYSRIIRYPVRFFDGHQTGDLMAKITNDVNQLQGTLNSFFVLGKDFIQAGFYLGFLAYLNWQLCVLIIGVFAITGYTLKRFSLPMRRAQHRIVENISDITSFLQETLSGIRVIKIFVKEKEETSRFRDLVYGSYARTMKAVRLIAFQKPVNELFSVIGVILVILFSGYQMINGMISISDFGLFIIVATMAYKPLKQLSDINNALQSAKASGSRIFELIDLPVEEPVSLPAARPAELSGVRGHIEFRNVFFEYKKNELVLKKISFTARPGEKIAIVGHSGSGKTTIAGLVPRFYDIRQGRILVDGTDLRRINIASLRKHIAVVPQDTFLFSGTIRENIAYGKPGASLEEVMEAARHANAHHFIMRLKDKYESHVGEKGVLLSGGEKQRISIARAILKDPKILILDEATSALDTQSEILVQKALNYLMKGKTTFMIAHRLSTVKNADRILVLENGEIVQTGNHAKLIRHKKGLYYQLCTAQTLFQQA